MDPSVGHELEAVSSRLLSSKAKDVKDALKRLKVLLDSPPLLQLLDETTLAWQHEAGQRLPVTTWPGMAECLCKCFAKEIKASQGKARGPDAAIPQLFKKFVQVAENHQRAGRRGLLSLRAARIFKHVKTVLQLTMVDTSTGNDYANVLRTHLLTEPMYCSRSSPYVFQDLLTLYLDRLELRLDSSEECYRAASTVQQLLKQFPGDMHTAFQLDMLDFFQKHIAPGITALSGDTRLGFTLLQAINTFLLSNGLNLLSKIPNLQAAWEPYILRHLKIIKPDNRHFEPLITFLQIQLRLGAFEAHAESLADIREALDRQVQQVSCWLESTRSGNLSMNRPLSSLMALTADVHNLSLHQDEYVAPAVDHSAASPPPAKRQKVQTPALQPDLLAFKQPLEWLPVLCALLKQSNGGLAPEVLNGWQQSLHQALCHPPVQLLVSKADHTLFWLLTCSSQLSNAFASSKAVNTSGPAKEAHEAAWQAIAERLVALLKTKQLSEQLEDQAALAVSSILQLIPQAAVRQMLGDLAESLHEPLRTPAAMLIRHCCSEDLIGAIPAGARRTFLYLLLNRSSVDEPSLAAELLLALRGSAQLQSQSDRIITTLPWPVSLTDEQQSLDNQLQRLTHGTARLLTDSQAWRPCPPQPRAALKPVSSAESTAIRVDDSIASALQALVSAIPEDEGLHLQQLLFMCSTVANYLWLRHMTVPSDEHDAQAAHGACAEGLKRFSVLLISHLEMEPENVSRLLHGFAQLNKDLLHFKLAIGKAALARQIDTCLDSCATNLHHRFTAAEDQLASRRPSSLRSGSQAVDLDDDLDNRGPVSTMPILASHAAAGHSNLQQQNQLLCIQLLGLLGSSGSEAAVHALSDIEQHTLSSEAVVPTGLMDATVAALCTASMSGAGIALEAASHALSSQADCMYAFHDAALQAILLHIQLVAQGCHTQNAAQASSTELQKQQASLERLLGALDKCLNIISQAEESENQHEDAVSPTSWRTRVAIAEAFIQLIKNDMSLFNGEENEALKNDCLDRLAKLLDDPCYQARSAGAKLCMYLFEAFQDVHVVFAELKQYLRLASPVSDASESLERAETSVLMLGELSCCCPAMEPEAVFLMCQHAASCPEHQQLVAAILDSASSLLFYPTRRAYMQYHQMPLAFAWIRNKNSLQKLLEIQDLVSVSEKQDAESSAAFLKSYEGYLVPPLLLHQADTDLLALCQGIHGPDTGTERIPKMLADTIDYIIGTLSPMRSCAEAADADRNLAVAALTRTMSRHISDAQRDVALGQSMVKTLGRCLLGTSEINVIALPSFPISTGLAAIHSLVQPSGTQDAQAYQEVLWTQVLTGSHVAKVLLMVHQQLALARHPAHLLRSLAPLKAVLQLLGDQVRLPLTFRYVAHILLWLLKARELHAQGASLLSKVIDVMVQTPASVKTLAAHMQPIMSGLLQCLDMKLQSQDGLQRQSNSCIEILILKVFEMGLPEVQKSLCAVEPLPSLDILAPAIDHQKQLRKHLLLSTEILVFKGQAASMGASRRHRLVAHLRNALQARAQQLSQGGSCIQQVEDAAWQLVHISNDLNDSACAALTGDLLAHVGTFPSGAIVHRQTPSARIVAAAGSSAHCNEPAGGHKSSAGRGARSVEASPLEPMLQPLLMLLADCLVDEAVPVIKAAQYILRKLLSRPPAQQALQRLPAAISEQLRCFASSVEAAPSASQGRSQLPQFQLENAKLWQPDGKSHETWVCHLTWTLLQHVDDPILRDCHTAAYHKAQVAELLLPYIFGQLGLDGQTNVMTVVQISEQLSRHVLNHRAGHHPKATRLILACLNHLRGYRLDAVVSGSKSKFAQEATCWQKVYWLDLDYLLVAEAALQCSASSTALIYIEQHCEDLCTQKGISLQLPDLQLLAQNNLPQVDQLMLEAYSQISEPDSIYAMARSPSLAVQLPLAEHEGSWAEALVGHDLQLHHTLQPGHESIPGSLSASSGSAQDFENKQQQGLFNALQQLGCQHVLQKLVSAESVQPGASHPSESHFEAAWRLQQWTHVEAEGISENAAVPFHQAFCGCLKALGAQDDARCLQLLQAGQFSIIQLLANAGTDSIAKSNPLIVQLQLLAAVAEVQQAQITSRLQAGTAGIKNLLQVWKDRQSSAGQDRRYELVEPLMAGHQALLRLLKQPDALVCALEDQAKAARKATRLLHAQSALLQLQLTVQQAAEGMESMALHAATCPDASWRLEEVKLLWAKGQQSQAQAQAGMALRMALAVAQHLQQAASSPSSTETGQALSHAHGRLLCLIGHWLADSRSESSGKILTVMQQGVEKMQSRSSAEAVVLCRSLHRLATYADHLYRAAEDYFRSQEWRTAQDVIKQKTAERDALRGKIKHRLKQIGNNSERQTKDREYRQLAFHEGTISKVLEYDEEEQRLKIANQTRYLQIALDAFRRSLLAGQQHDLQTVFRLCQLWFTLSALPDVNDQMAKAFHETPSYKFLPLVYQLASRLTTISPAGIQEDSFQAALQDQLVRLGCQHPYHTLYHLFALKNGNLGKDGRPTAPGLNAGGMLQLVDHSKIEAATAVLQKIQQSSSRRNLLDQMQQMIRVYVRMAAAPGPADKTKMSMTLDRECRDTRNLDLIPPVSISIPVDPSGAYTGLPHFCSFGSQVKFVGGVNRPKLVECQDSQGQTHRQLVKSGHDDLRQDAVMQQFFHLLNSFLQSRPSSRRRCLRIATYKVVPFTPAAGLLEWVEETEPLLPYLIGDHPYRGGAWGRYHRPHDKDFVQSRGALEAVQKSVTSLDKMAKAFNQICKQHTPVLHHFFLERFREPPTWFERRLAFTRSVAVSSIAGYIIGLGDRHLNNILIDSRSAEVVHIDLGVAFEQGRFLNTPELVPFRLTQNLVDGMGVTGVEGVMARCCVETLQALRENMTSVLTIVEVFIHDPLYKWAMTPYDAQQRQHGDQEVLDGPSERDARPLNADAERALLRVQQKLKGLTGGEGEARSAEGQVKQLLQDAQSPYHLSRMYLGWAPWL
ncbi:hypothetical protein WJX74_001187 [Apatococcus lobatus]|uniref:non-specific serine/threonine protein kinase n=1 Tax=Apatococcus lobatus TaxID=904363 RepID=A0AAW1R3Q5_9CHLO